MGLKHLIILALILPLFLVPRTAVVEIRSRERRTLTIVRLIPGDQQATVEWRDPECINPHPDFNYQVASKFRTASWDNAKVINVPGNRHSATITGLLNHADYTVKVIVEDSDTSSALAESNERLIRPEAAVGIVIDYLHKDDPAFLPKGQYIGSPSIARLEDGHLVASHDLFGGGGTQDFTRVFRSDDNGETWKHIADVDRAFWGKLFVHKARLYLLACSRQNGDLLLHHSPDGGETWASPVFLAAGSYHKAPVPIIVHRGRLWTCVEAQTGGWPAGFQAVALSVPDNENLLDRRNWTVSDPLPYNSDWLPKGWEIAQSAQGFLEGNAVVDPKGNLLNILRYHVSPYHGKAVVLNISMEGDSLSFNRVIDFPGGMTKFTIRQHPESGVYWSLANRVTDPTKPAMRSVLTLISSRDLDNWTLVRDVLRDDREIAPQYVAFQYVDWLYDAEDIIFVSRTAYNGAHNYHDANHMTFHRIRNFASEGRWVGP